MNLILSHYNALAELQSVTADSITFIRCDVSVTWTNEMCTIR